MRRSARRLLSISALLWIPLAARAGDLCSCGAGDDFAWKSVGVTSGTGAWSCGAGAPDAGDAFRIGAGCRVRVTGDILQDGGSSSAGLSVEAGGTLRAVVARDRLRLSLNGGGLYCQGTCQLRGSFRELDASPVNAVNPVPWPAGALDPCGGDCDATPERFCLAYPAGSPPGIESSLDQVVPGSGLGTGTQDWLCFWDFDKTDALAAFDDNSCYPISSVRGSADAAPLELCVDVRQGNDNDYPWRLRLIDEGELAAALAPGDGCSYVLDPAGGRRTPTCNGAFVRVNGARSGIQEDGEYIGRFLRLSDASGAPESVSYKILQTLDCAAAPPAPHPCGGSADDIIVLGSLAGVAGAHAAGGAYWIDYGWKPGDTFFVLAPLQVDSATPARKDSNVELSGTIDAYGLHVTDLGGGPSPSGNDAHAVLSIGPADPPPQVQRWRHVILRNDTGDFVTNTGRDLVADSLVHAVIGHTNILSNSGHAVVVEASEGPSRGLVFEDTSIRHHHDGCFNHSYDDVTPEVTVRRAWCAFIQRDAVSAQFFAWQRAIPTRTLIEDSGCDACDGGHQGPTLRSNSTTWAGGWRVHRTLFWAPVGAIAIAYGSRVEDSLFLGFRGSDSIGSPLLPPEARRLVVRDVAIRMDKTLAEPLDYRDGVFRDVLVARATPVVLAGAGARLENNAWLNFENVHPSCLAGSPQCSVAGELTSATVGVAWIDNLFAWTPGAMTGFFGALRYRAVGALDPPTYDGIAIANHAFSGGVGEALSGLTPANVGNPDWGHGPCFFGNERDVHPGALPGMPPTTSSGAPLGFVDPAGYRFDVPAGARAHQVGCGLDPANPPGNLGYAYIHARTGLAPEIMADDGDGDGVPENIPAPACTGPIGDSACVDNCVGIFNPGQADADTDGLGDACEPACANGLDDDGDGLVDWPADPACASASALDENRLCQNGLDDDGDGRIDFDGAASWNGGVPLTPADPGCGGLARRNRESGACGVGFELAFALGALAALRRRARRQPIGT